MKRLVFLLVIFSLVAPGSYYGMKNISKKVPKYNFFKKDFSTKSWRWSKVWNNVKNYPTLWNNKIFNKVVVPNIKDNRIENVSIINKDTGHTEIKKNSALHSDKKIMINFSDSKQSSEFARKTMSTWKEVKGKPFRKFYEFVAWSKNQKIALQKPSFAQTKIKHEEQASDSYWKYFFGGAFATYLAKLFFDSAQQVSVEKKKVSFDYSLDGELVRTMSADDFVNLLHKNGLTVANAVEYQVKKKEEEIYKELTQLAGLTEIDWRKLQNLWGLKEEFLQGHYDNDNIIFNGVFKQETIQIIKDVLKNFDIPFNITIVTKDTAKIVPRETTQAEGIHASVWSSGSLLWSVDEDSAEYSSFGYFNIEFYMNENHFMKDLDSLLNTVAHEAIHILNMHTYQEIFFKEYLIHGKNFDVDKVNNYTKPLVTLQEYQADVLPLAVAQYAKASKGAYDLNKYTISRPDIYLSSKKLFTLASRAVDLHEAEAKLLIKNSTEVTK